MTLFLEDFTLGRGFQSQSRIVTDEDVRNFAQVSGDLNPLHLDDSYAQKTMFGGRIAHGLLGLSAASGLLHDLGILQESVVAFTGIEWKFKAPLRIGDGISLALEVTRTRAMGPGKGLVSFKAVVSNQKKEIIQQGEWTFLVKGRLSPTTAS